MTAPEGEDWGALHQRVLAFMGAFSSVQFAIDTVVGLYLKRRMPDLGSELDKQFIRKIRDDQRLPLFKAFAAEAKYDGDLTQFAAIYGRAKQVRDLIGHSLNVAGPVYSQGKSSSVAVASMAKRDLLPNPLLPSTFTRLTADCEWLQAHVHRAGWTIEPQMFKTFTKEPYEPPVPSVLPEGGEPLA
jgi:hypothetical protein